MGCLEICQRASVTLLPCQAHHNPPSLLTAPSLQRAETPAPKVEFLLACYGSIKIPYHLTSTVDA
jgi:hypothetical protein